MDGLARAAGAYGPAGPATGPAAGPAFMWPWGSAVVSPAAASHSWGRGMHPGQPWTTYSHHQQQQQSHHQHQLIQQHVVEDLYPDSCEAMDLCGGGSALTSPYGPGGDLAMSLAVLPTYQEYHIQSDSLLPDDSYAQPPPDYPLYNWTLPYGPDLQLQQMQQLQQLPHLPILTPAPTPSPSPSPAPQRARHRPRQSTPASMVSRKPGNIRVQFKGPSEIRLPAPHTQLDKQVPPAYINLHGPCLELDDDVVEVEVRSCRQDEPSASERVTFNSIEEALASIEGQDFLGQDHLGQDHLGQQQQEQRVAEPECTAGRSASTPGTPGPRSTAEAVGERGLPLAPSLADEKQDEVVKAAKSLFSKRTRTLYQWLYPDTSKTKLKATVSAAWDTLAEPEKQFYLSQVLGRFGLQASSLMINPQLDGLKGLPVPDLGRAWTPTSVTASVPSSGGRQAVVGRQGCGDGASPAAIRTAIRTAAVRSASPPLTEAQKAVNGLFASCSDAETWTSFSMSASCTSPTSEPTVSRAAPRTAARSNERTLCGHPDRRKRPGPASGPSSGRPGVRAGTPQLNQVDVEVSLVNPKESPKVISKESPKVIPRVSPKVTTRVSPKVTPRVSPKVIPRACTVVIPRVSPMLTQRVSPEATPRVNPEATRRVNPEATPRVNPETTPRVIPEATPRMIPKVNAEVTSKEDSPRKLRSGRTYYPSVTLESDDELSDSPCPPSSTSSTAPSPSLMRAPARAAGGQEPEEPHGGGQAAGQARSRPRAGRR